MVSYLFIERDIMLSSAYFYQPYFLHRRDHPTPLHPPYQGDDDWESHLSSRQVLEDILIHYANYFWEALNNLIVKRLVGITAIKDVWFRTSVSKALKGGYPIYEF